VKYETVTNNVINIYSIKSRGPQLANSLFNVYPWLLVPAAHIPVLIWESASQHAVNVANKFSFVV
jgi:hypothetical protein